jgi:putative addiction module component (TIGR02574 family)
MSMEEIGAAALALPPESRVSLVELLLASLEPPLELKYHEEWMEEIKQRLEAYERGEMKSYSLEEVMRDL